MTDLPIINCEGCGACCKEQLSPPMYLYWIARGAHKTKTYDDLTDEDVVRLRTMPPDVLDGLVAYHAKVAAGEARDDETCIWLQDGQCRHYDWRPQICRDFELGCDGCRRWRKKYPPTTTTNLEGIDDERFDSVREATTDGTRDAGR